MNYEPLVLNHNHNNVKPKELVKTPRSVVSSSIGINKEEEVQGNEQAVVSRRIVSSTNPSRVIADPEVVGKRGREKEEKVGEVGEEEDMLSALKRLKGGLNRNPNRNISTTTASTSTTSGGTGPAMHPSIISRDAVIQVKVKVPSPKKKGPIMSTSTFSLSSSDIRPVDSTKSNSSSNSSNSSVETSRARDPRIIRAKGGGGGGGGGGLDMQLMGSATDTDTDTPINSSLIVGRPVVDKEHLSVVDGSTIGSAHLSPTKPFTYDIDGSIIDTAAAGPYAGYFADPELETSPSLSPSSSVVDRRPENASSEYRSETDDDDIDDDDDDDEEEEEVVDEDDPTEGWGDGGSSDDNDVEGSDLEDGEVVIADPMSMRRNRSMKRKRKRRLEEEAAAPDTSYEMQRHALSTPSLLSPSLQPPSPISSSQSGDDPDSSSSSGDDDFSDFEAMILQRTGQMQRPASSGPAWSLPSQGRSLVRNNNNHQGNNKYQGNHSNRGSDTTGNDDDSNSPN